jgi:hypothetical protein
MTAFVKHADDVVAVHNQRERRTPKLFVVIDCKCQYIYSIFRRSFLLSAAKAASTTFVSILVLTFASQPSLHYCSHNSASTTRDGNGVSATRILRLVINVERHFL